LQERVWARSISSSSGPKRAATVTSVAAVAAGRKRGAPCPSVSRDCVAVGAVWTDSVSTTRTEPTATVYAKVRGSCRAGTPTGPSRRLRLLRSSRRDGTPPSRCVTGGVYREDEGRQRLPPPQPTPLIPPSR
jgi:hypothetical protein